MLWKKIWSSPMLSPPPLPEFCSESQSGQSKVEANVSTMQSVDHVLTKLEVEQMLGSGAGELLEGGGEEKEPVVEGESSLPFPSTTTATDQLCQPHGGGKVEPLATGMYHQSKPVSIRAKAKMRLCRLCKLLHTR